MVEGFSLVTIPMDDNLFFLLIFILIVLAIIVISYYFNDRNKILRNLKKVPVKRIASIKENEYAKLFGKATALDTPLVSPLSKRKCVYYQIKVEKKVNTGKSSSWKTIIKEEKYIDFALQSLQEKVIIHTNGSHKLTYLVKDVKKRSGFLNDASQNLEHYLNQHQESSEGFFGLNKTLRYNEGVIEIDEEIAVMGTGNWKESDHNFDRYSSKTLYLSGDKTNKLLITDDPKALTTG